MARSTGRTGQDFVCSRYPAWYWSKYSGFRSIREQDDCDVDV